MTVTDDIFTFSAYKKYSLDLIENTIYFVLVCIICGNISICLSKISSSNLIRIILYFAIFPSLNIVGTRISLRSFTFFSQSFPPLDSKRAQTDLCLLTDCVNIILLMRYVWYIWPLHFSGSAISARNTRHIVCGAAPPRIPWL